MNCKFKFHLRAALHRGAAGPVGSAEVGGPAGVPDETLPGWWSSAEVGEPAGVPDEALPNLVGTAGPAGLR